MLGVICTPPPLQYLKGLFPVPQTKSTRYFLHALCRAELSTQEDRTASLGVAPTRQQEVSQAWDWQVSDQGLSEGHLGYLPSPDKWGQMSKRKLDYLL